MMVIHPAGRDCANLLSRVFGLVCVVVSLVSAPSGLFSGLHKSHMSQAMGVWATLVRPLLTSLLHTAATCLARVLSCSTKADHTSMMSPQS